MKLTNKIFDVLEFVFLQNGNAVTPSMIADIQGMNIATATRILQDLNARGYLHQVSRKTGYVPGPMIESLATRKNVFSEIANAAAAPVRELSEAIQQQVNISVLDGVRRVMLCFYLPRIGLSPWDHFFFTDHWQTATGRLLLASLEKTEAESVFRVCRIPEKNLAVLKKIRMTGYVCFRQDDLVVMGHLVRVPGYPAAAFGFGVPPEQEKEAFLLSGKTAKTISRNLCKNNKAY